MALSESLSIKKECINRAQSHKDRIHAPIILGILQGSVLFLLHRGLDRQFTLLQVIDVGAGALVSRHVPVCVFGKAMTSRIEAAPSRIMAIRSSPEGDTTVRRCAIFECVHKEPEFFTGFLVTDPQNPEDALLKVGAVNTDRTAADFFAVEGDIVGQRAKPSPGSDSNLSPILGMWHREGVVRRGPPAIVAVPIK